VSKNSLTFPKKIDKKTIKSADERTAYAHRIAYHDLHLMQRIRNHAWVFSKSRSRGHKLGPVKTKSRIIKN